MKLRVVAPPAAIGVAALAGWYFFARPVTPAGQPALVELQPGALSAFTREFNAASGLARAVLLLSPT